MATTVTSIIDPDSGPGTDYTSLSAWDAGEVGDLTGVRDEIARAVCRSSSGTADTAQCVLGAWTTDATRYILIEADTGHEASTVWSTSKYRLSRTAILVYGCLDISTALYCRVNGLQIEGSVASLEANSRACICIITSPLAGTSGADIRISRCYIRVVGTNPTYGPFTSSCHGIFGAPGTTGATPAPNFYVYNNIISYESTESYPSSTAWTGLRIEHRNHNLYAYNNTIVGAWYNATGGDYTDGGRYHYLKNNIFSGCTIATSGDHTNTRCDYNSTNLSDLGYTAGSNDRVSQTFTFVSATDFALASGDTGAKDYGLSDPGSGLFSDDINRVTRSGSWDIGADEYILQASNFPAHFPKWYFG